MASQVQGYRSFMAHEGARTTARAQVSEVSTQEPSSPSTYDRSDNEKGGDRQVKAMEMQDGNGTERSSTVASAMDGSGWVFRTTSSPKRPLASVELPADELLMQAVLSRLQEFADPLIQKRLVWDSIAVLLCDQRFADGRAAQARVSWLQRVWQDETNRVHTDLTDSLKQLIAQYRDARHTTGEDVPAKGKRGRRIVCNKLGARKRKKSMTIASQGTPEEFPVTREEAESVLSVAKEAEEASLQGAEGENVDSFPRLCTKRKQTTMDAELEEKVMRIVLRHAPRFETAEAKIDVWEEIARESRGRYSSGDQARVRTAWLSRTMRYDNYPCHASITPTLRTLLMEFLKFEPAPHRRVVMDGKTSAVTTDVQQVELTGKKAQIRRRAPRYDESGDSDDDSSEDYSTSDFSEDGALPLPTAQENGELLCELLRVRPFQTGGERISVKWERVADTMRSIFGTSTTLMTGKACVVQMKRLLHAVRHPNRSSSMDLPDSQVDMVALLDKLIKTRWSRVNSRKTDKHRQLELQIEEAINARVRRSTNSTLEAGGEGESSVDRHDEGQHDVNSDTGPSQADEITSLRSSFAKCRAQLRLQSDDMERERHECRAEWRSAMEMLKEERETSKRQTAALLEILKQEQQDRRREFEAMVGLINKTVFPPPLNGGTSNY